MHLWKRFRKVAAAIFAVALAVGLLASWMNAKPLLYAFVVMPVLAIPVSGVIFVLGVLLRRQQMIDKAKLILRFALVILVGSFAGTSIVYSLGLG